MTATTTAALVPIQPAFSDAERLALAGFLAGYRGLTREAYALGGGKFFIASAKIGLNEPGMALRALAAIIRPLRVEPAGS